MTERHPVRPGAEPVSHEGNDVGVLVLHGFTGSPQTMRPVTDALVAAGFTVESPRLPGHGTHVDDMLVTTWDDWSAVAEQAYVELAARRETTVVVGLSMGGTLAAWLAGHHETVAGAVFVNPLVAPFDPMLRQMAQEMVDVGETIVPGVGSDIAKPDAHEDAYDGTPLAPLLTLMDGVGELQPLLPNIACPVLIMTSVEDHVVDPASSDHLAASVSGPVERVALERSYHVATHDHDAPLVIDRTLDFVRKIAAG